MMRTLASIFLLALFTVPFFFGPKWLSMERRQIQKHVRNQILPTLDESELISFTVLCMDSALFFDWEHAKEFEFQGKMYDIVQRNTHEDSITYLVWQDDKETAVNLRIKRLANSVFNLSHDGYHHQVSFQLLINSLYLEDNSTQLYSFFFEPSRKWNHTYQGIPHCGFCITPFNPPQYV